MKDLYGIEGHGRGAGSSDVSEGLVGDRCSLECQECQSQCASQHWWGRGIGGRWCAERGGTESLRVPWSTLGSCGGRGLEEVGVQPTSPASVCTRGTFGVRTAHNFKQGQSSTQCSALCLPAAPPAPRPTPPQPVPRPTRDPLPHICPRVPRSALSVYVSPTPCPGPFGRE